MHSCKSDIGLQLEPVYFFLLRPGTNILLDFYLLGQCSRLRLLILLSGTVTGSLFIEYHWLNQLTSFILTKNLLFF
jgi:hypothetical protein